MTRAGANPFHFIFGGLAVALILATPTSAQQNRIDRLEIIEAGFYTATESGQQHAAPGTTLGYVSEQKDIQFLKAPPAVSAKVGTNFGVQFKVHGSKPNAVFPLRTVWKIPEPGVHNPRNNNVYRESTSDFTVKTDEIVLRGFGLDEPWEVVPGVWTLQVWQGDRKLLEQSFTIK